MKRFLVSLALLLSAVGIALLLLWFGKQERKAAFFNCLECGRLEWREWNHHEILSSTLADDGSVFRQRFANAIPSDHVHDWVVRGCIFEGDTSHLVESIGQVWVELLPRLSDSAGAEALFREAIALPPEQRHELISSFEGVLGASRGKHDEAFADWRAKRQK